MIRQIARGKKNAIDMDSFVILVLLILTLTVKAIRPQFTFFQIAKDETNCRCVLRQDCGDDDADVNGYGLLDPRRRTTPCPNFREICCETTIDRPETVRQCGNSHDNSMQFRITSESSPAHFAEFPWNVMIMENDIYRCGGSLIHLRVILTAAHCVDAAGQLVIRAGDWNMENDNEPLPAQNGDVEYIILHPDYNRASLSNDIALLLVEKPFILADNVGLACLPTPDLIVDKNRCIASGWGRESFDIGPYSSVLRKVEVPIVPREECLTRLRSTRLGKYYELPEGFICAGGEKNRDTCKGDGGSPLVCPAKGGGLIQVGVVSWGIGCGTNRVPGVYVDVEFYVPWIDETLMQKGVDIHIYKY